MKVKKQQLEPDMEHQTSSKFEKEYIKAIYCHPAYLTSIQSTSRKMLGWMKHKLELRLLGYADDTTLMAENKEALQSLLMKVKEESEKADLKLNIQKIMIKASSPITSWQIDREKNGKQTLFSWALKSLWMVTAAMKLKDACSLQEKL